MLRRKFCYKIMILTYGRNGRTIKWQLLARQKSRVTRKLLVSNALHDFDSRILIDAIICKRLLPSVAIRIQMSPNSMLQITSMYTNSPWWVFRQTTCTSCRRILVFYKNYSIKTGDPPNRGHMNQGLFEIKGAPNFGVFSKNASQKKAV